MSRCTNKGLGRLLHDYELGLLLEEEKREFEMHVYDCDYCLKQAREFIDVSRTIRHDPEAKQIYEDIAAEPGDVHPGTSRRKSSAFTKFLLAAVIVAVLTIPAYRYWLQSETTPVVQTLELLPSRAGGIDIIYIDRGGEVEISFYMAEDFQGEVDLIISSMADDTVLHTPGFSDFNDKGLGSITLPVEMFSDGHYTLTLTPQSDTTTQRCVYMFRGK